MSDTALLVLSTVPHLFVIPFVSSPAYGGIVLWSTLLSALWHATGSDPYTLLGVLDHLMAAIWFSADCYYFWDSRWLLQVIVLNAATALANTGVGYLTLITGISYAAAHSVWHLMSVAKALYVAFLLTRLDRSRV
jgi:hypothetical protein